MADVREDFAEGLISLPMGIRANERISLAATRLAPATATLSMTVVESWPACAAASAGANGAAARRAATPRNNRRNYAFVPEKTLNCIGCLPISGSGSVSLRRGGIDQSLRERWM